MANRTKYDVRGLKVKDSLDVPVGRHGLSSKTIRSYFSSRGKALGVKLSVRMVTAALYRVTRVG